MHLRDQRLLLILEIALAATTKSKSSKKGLLATATAEVAKLQRALYLEAAEEDKDRKIDKV